MDLSRVMLAWTTGLAHMLVFMAGAKSTGTLVAMTMVVRKSSAMPLAILPMMLAVAGAITSRSARSASEMWPIFEEANKVKISVVTGFPERV